jgi:hypothetical protein
MKKTIFYLRAMVLTLAGGQLAFAQEEAQSDKPDWRKDFSVTIGTKVWVNEWQIDRFLSQSTRVFPTLLTDVDGDGSPDDIIFSDVSAFSRDTAPDTFISDVEPTPIPQLSIKYKQFFVTGSYYYRTDFDFPQQTLRLNEVVVLEDFFGSRSEQNITFNAVFNTKGERYEWDASVGWYIHPYVALLVGYKEINIKTNFTITNSFTTSSGTTPLDPQTGFSEIKNSGPTLGIAGSVPIAHGFGIYASYAHGFMDVDSKDVSVSPQPGESSFDFDADYDVAELGFSYTPNMAALLPHMPLSAATIYAGYRYQTIEADIPEPEGDRKDITQGFVAGLNLTW